jgi:hypothetical protein
MKISLYVSFLAPLIALTEATPYLEPRALPLVQSVRAQTLFLAPESADIHLEPTSKIEESYFDQNSLKKDKSYKTSHMLTKLATESLAAQATTPPSTTLSSN